MSRSGAWEGRGVEGTFMDGQRGRFYLKRGNFPHYLPLSNRVINLAMKAAAQKNVTMEEFMGWAVEEVAKKIVEGSGCNLNRESPAT